MIMDGVEIFLNASAANHEVRISLPRVIALIKNVVAKVCEFYLHGNILKFSFNFFRTVVFMFTQITVAVMGTEFILMVKQ